MTGRQVVDVHADSTASPAAVWELLADATTWTGWARFNKASYLVEGVPAPHGVGAVRRFHVRGLRSKETVLVFDPPKQLAYDYAGSLPIRDYRAEVTLEPQGDGTRITWHATFTSKLPLLGPLLRVVITRVLQDVASRLAVAAAG
jgi:carbon monoxide dehydrogenase subunit G